MSPIGLAFSKHAMNFENILIDIVSIVYQKPPDCYLSPAVANYKTVTFSMFMAF